MPTQKRRLNITLSQEVDKALTLVAQRDNVPQATAASELLKRALEIEEDALWDSIAKKRDTKNAKFVDHDTVWA